MVGIARNSESTYRLPYDAAIRPKVYIIFASYPLYRIASQLQVGADGRERQEQRARAVVVAPGRCKEGGQVCGEGEERQYWCVRIKEQD